MKMLIIEPHSDDTLLSSLFSLNDIRKDYDVYLYTITNSNVSNTHRDSSQFCKYANINFIPNTTYIPQIFYKYGLKTLNGAKIEDQFNIFYEHYQDIYRLIAYNIANIINVVNPQVILTCYGIFHCTHVFTAHVIRQFNIPTIHYLDNPYYENNITIGEKYEVNAEEIKLKQQLLTKFYPSEAYMIDLYPNIYSLPEYTVY